MLQAPDYRIVYAPWLKPVMRLLVPNWAAMTLGHTILAATPLLSAAVLRHEQVHITQWDANGLLFPLRYAAASLSAVLHGQHWYLDNAYEVEARGE